MNYIRDIKHTQITNVKSYMVQYLTECSSIGQNTVSVQRKNNELLNTAFYQILSIETIVH